MAKDSCNCALGSVVATDAERVKADCSKLPLVACSAVVKETVWLKMLN